MKTCSGALFRVWKSFPWCGKIIGGVFGAVGGQCGALGEVGESG
jgi:hypothetical protein